MTIGIELNLIAGVATVALGAGVLWHGADQPRNRIFALLCAAVAVWNLGLVGNRVAWLPGLPWNQIFLAGSCTAAIIALHFAMVLVGQRGWLRRVLLPVTYLIFFGYWLSSWLPIYDTHRQPWNRVAASFSGLVAGLGVFLIAREVRRQPPGPLRRAYIILLAGTILAILGEMSDFLPLDRSTVPRVGVLFLLLLLVIVSAVLVRYRFLDVNVFLARAAVLLGGAAMATMLILVTVRLAGAAVLPTFLAVLITLLLAVPVGRWIWRGTSRLLGPADPVAETLLHVSRRLSTVRSAAELWRCIEDGRRELTPDLLMRIYLDSGPGTAYRLLQPRTGGSSLSEVAPDAALPRVLQREQAPVPRHLLMAMGPRQGGHAAGVAARALDQMVEMDVELLVPLLAERRLAGWIGMGGADAARHLTHDVAAGLMAVGNQALASLARIEAMERARQSEALAAVGELAAGLAHEIRNPVAAIQGASQAMGADASQEQSREMLDVIAEEASRLERFVAEFLDYARPREPRRVPCDLGALARHVVRRFQIAGAGLQCDVRIENGVPQVHADRDQIERTFENLVRNAAEATGSDGRLWITIGPQEAEQVVAIFQDNGPGIPEKEIPLLFRPFHTRKAGGTGLGLALAHRIVAAHGGEIRVDGGHGHGAVFSVMLPIGEPLS